MSLLNPYCTVAQVQEELRNSKLDLQTTLEEAINQASRFIDDWRGRDFYQHDYLTTALEIDDFDQMVVSHMLFLPYRPIIGTLTEVKQGSTTLVANVDYVAKSNRLYRIDQEWGCPTRPDNVITLKGKFGYAQTTSSDMPALLPAEINRAAILIAAAFSGHNQKELVGLDGQKQDVIDKAIPKTALTILGPRRWVLG